MQLPLYTVPSMLLLRANEDLQSSLAGRGLLRCHSPRPREHQVHPLRPDSGADINRACGATATGCQLHRDSLGPWELFGGRLVR